MPEPETGTVLCDDFTKGRRAPRTMSRLPGGVELWWGRQDLAVYIVAGPPMIGALMTVPWWWPLITGTFPGVLGVALSLFILVGIPFTAGAMTAAAGINSRDLPRLTGELWARTPFARPGSQAAFYTPGPEPRVRFNHTAWVLPDPDEDQL